MESASTLSFSLHEVAAILGPDITESDLLTSFDLFMRDLDEVKQGVIVSVSNFMSSLSPSCRESYLPILSEIHSSKAIAWRFRQHLADQLGTL